MGECRRSAAQASPKHRDCQGPACDPQGGHGAPGPGPAGCSCAGWGSPEGRHEAGVCGLGAGVRALPLPLGAPPRQAPHPLLSPLFSPGKGEERATACAPQTPKPSADGLSKAFQMEFWSCASS